MTKALLYRNKPLLIGLNKEDFHSQKQKLSLLHLHLTGTPVPDKDGGQGRDFILRSWSTRNYKNMYKINAIWYCTPKVRAE